MTFMDFADLVIYAWAFVSIAGLIIYKFELLEVDTWEAGIKGLITYIGKIIFSNDEPAPLNQTLALSNEEVLELVKRFDNKPLETPSLEAYSIAADGVMQFSIASLGLISKYENMTNDNIREMVYKIIQNFYMETRQCQVPIYIGVATPKRLQFGIPLSECAQQRLEEQQRKAMKKPENAQIKDGIEEVIEFEDSEEV